MTSKTSGLKKYSAQKRESARLLAFDALAKLIKSGAMINFNTMSSVSGLSKTYLYNNREVRNEIEKMRNSQANFPKNEKQKNITTDKGKDVIILAMKRKIDELASENAKLKKDNQILRGQIYDLS